MSDRNQNIFKLPESATPELSRYLETVLTTQRTLVTCRRSPLTPEVPPVSILGMKV